MRTDCSVRPARADERALIEGLLQFYVYDFSDMEPAASDRFDFDDCGGYPPWPDLGDYWSRDGFHPLLILSGGKVAGFALVNTHSHQGGEVERNMGEFFIARKYRRAGIGAAAVAAVLSALPGVWEVAVADRNLVAKAFWPTAIAAAPCVSGLVRLEGDGDHWRGPIWRFTAL